MAGRWFVLLRTAGFAVVFMGTVGIYLPRYMGLLHRAAPLDWRMVGIVPLVVGGFIALRCAFEFAWRGRGTPAPFDPPRRLVVSGLYRYVRNPMYSGMALFMIGEWMIWGTRPTAALQYLALYAVCVLLFVLAYEEPVLEKKFGEDYLMFRRNVPRFLPRLTAWDPEKAKGATNSGS